MCVSKKRQIAARMCSFCSVIGYPGRPALLLLKGLKGGGGLEGRGRGVRFGREQKLILTAEIMGLLWHQIRRLKLRLVVGKQRRANAEGSDGPTCCKPRLFSGGGVGGG